MKFRAPKGGLALHSVATVIEHMVWQPVRLIRPVLISDAGEHMNTVEGGSAVVLVSQDVHKQGYVI